MRKTVATNNIKEGHTYYWFHTVGESMTDGTPRQILSGSQCLGREIIIKDHRDFLQLNGKVVIIHGILPSGQDFRVCKKITFCDFAFSEGSLRLSSFNPDVKDFWILMRSVVRVFEVEQVRFKTGQRWKVKPVSNTQA